MAGVGEGLLIGATVASALAAGTGIVMQDQAAKKSRAMQRDAQSQAMAAAGRQNQATEADISKKKKQTDLAGLLASLQGSTPQPGTLLTGPNGTGSGSTMLGQ